MHLCFPLLSLLDIPRHYVSPSLRCLSFFIFLCIWSLGGEWPLTPLGNNLLLRSELVPMQDCRIYFPWRSYLLIPLKSVQGLAQVLVITALTHTSWVYAMPHVVAWYVPLASSYNLLLFLGYNHACECSMHLWLCLISFLNPIYMHDFRRHDIHMNTCIFIIIAQLFII